MRLYVVIVVASIVGLVSLQNPDYTEKCILQYCPTEFSACMVDSGCVKLVDCVSACWFPLYNDPSYDIMVIMNCTNKCTYTYSDAVFQGFLTCMNMYECFYTRPIFYNKCNRTNLKFQKNLTLSDLTGTWWTLSGYNKAFDCYPCQKTTFTATTIYETFQAYLVDGGLKPFNITGTVADNSPKPGFTVTVPLILTIRSTFWPFDLVEDGKNKYVLVYYCTEENFWNYDGAYVFSAATNITEIAMVAIRSSFEINVGLNFDEFCSPSTTNCPN